MDIRNSIKKARKPLDSITKGTKMKATRSTNSTTAKRRKVIIKNMAASMNSMSPRKVNTRKERNMIQDMMKDTKVSDQHIFDSRLID